MTAEQAGAGLDRLSEKEFAAFHRLNVAYHAKFGIPFIVCVRRHGKDRSCANSRGGSTTTPPPSTTPR